MGLRGERLNGGSHSNANCRSADRQVVAEEGADPDPHRYGRSHRDYHAELCVTAHHAGISLGRLFERIGFNHGPHAS